MSASHEFKNLSNPRAAAKALRKIEETLITVARSEDLPEYNAGLSGRHLADIQTPQAYAFGLECRVEALSDSIAIFSETPADKSPNPELRSLVLRGLELRKARAQRLLSGCRVM